MGVVALLVARIVGYLSHLFLCVGVSECKRITLLAALASDTVPLPPSCRLIGTFVELRDSLKVDSLLSLICSKLFVYLSRPLVSFAHEPFLR
jgi:hypothetical protein